MGKSSKDKRDAYYRLAKEQGWRARKFDLFSDVTRVVDLCAAPGSWSQVLSRVLIKGEKFGRAAWEDKEARMRQNILEINLPSSTEERQPSPNETELKPKKDVKIVAIDLQPMSPLQGIITLRADITHPATVPLLLSALDSSYDPKSLSQQASNPVDLVISDGAPDVTGLHDLDIYVQSQLLFAALNLALCVLRPGGKFVAKIFRGRNVDLLFAQLKIFFERVVVAKPRSSRASSVEAFIVCLNFQPPEGFKASMEDPMGVGDRLAKMVDTAVSQEPTVSPVDSQNIDDDKPSENQVKTTTRREDGVWEVKLPNDEAKARKSGRWIAPFLACGDLSGYDADASYHLPKDRITLDPVQPPTAPPYKRALEMRKAAGGAYGKTTTGKAE
ncbi:putative trna (uridine-2 -o-)-methyltransferase trm7 protein [Botrytis fragariae]|uniref:Putative tRNA (cytidine(32)/guanosine(34)-2'-O)-methyltransferase n=1 Tax=Botrytis fragariae TaxID=1964551 RepID=A0A8H6EFP2_9HELO|nr:putative trna (uridine-2 -o-)-methyltransferase trm7 protein [Botrytis fragariae]KAF5870438.1 putative trna (uridine-2 -o-)-methyltransferase trm7 protein [Botrytis fragariae]